MVLDENILPLQPPANALEICQRLQQAGHQAVFAGGCVRDALLGKAPNDWDIATSAPPEQVEALFAPHTVAVGKQFGIIVVVMPGGEDYEVATFRGESEYTDGRHPGKIHFVPMAEDVKRRDFTVNALLYDPLEKRIHDFVGGIPDLKAGILRAVGEPLCRFTEDKLRVLRAIRFAANLGFDIEPETFRAVKQIAPEVRAAVSAARIAAELDKMLVNGHAAAAMALLESSGLLEQLFPELAAMVGVQQPPQFHPEGDVWQHTLKLLGFLDETVRRCRTNGECASPATRLDDQWRLCQASADEVRGLAWAALLHDVGKPGTFFQAEDRIHFNGHDALGATISEEFLKRLRMPNNLVDLVDYLVAGHMNVITLPKARVATRLRKYLDPRFPLLLEINRLDSLASFGGLELHDAIAAEWRQEAIKPPHKKPTITGNDLIVLGLKPSPRFGEILQHAEDHELEHPFRDHDDAIAWLKKELKHL